MREHTAQERFVQGVFNNIARKYDFMNSLMSLGLDHYWRNALVKNIGNIRACQGLDVCCGTGKLSSALARAVGDTGAITGLDFSDKMLAVAKERYADNKQIKFIQGNALALPFADNTFDFASVAWGLRNVQDIPQALREMTRVVKSGGQIIAIDMAEPPNIVLNKIYWLLFAGLIPSLGKLLVKNKEAYQYLHESVQTFPKQEALSHTFREAGLVDVSYRNLSCGVVVIVKGVKNR